MHPLACTGYIASQQRRSCACAQGAKPAAEKNLRFLLQKVLKQSDVGTLGRIVLPKVRQPSSSISSSFSILSSTCKM
jgi:hypothetical protein